MISRVCSLSSLRLFSLCRAQTHDAHVRPLCVCVQWRTLAGASSASDSLESLESEDSSASAAFFRSSSASRLSSFFDFFVCAGVAVGRKGSMGGERALTRRWPVATWEMVDETRRWW